MQAGIILQEILSLHKSAKSGENYVNNYNVALEKSLTTLDA